jgi:hypothetical protein
MTMTSARKVTKKKEMQMPMNDYFEGEDDDEEAAKKVAEEAKKAECESREANVLKNLLQHSALELQNEIQSTYLLCSIAQDPKYQQPQQLLAASQEVRHESLLLLQQVQYDHDRCSTITDLPYGPPAALQAFVEEVCPKTSACSSITINNA